MATLGKSQEGEEEDLTAPEALVNDKRKGNMGLFNVCDMLTCYFLLCKVYTYIFKIKLLYFYNIF